MAEPVELEKARAVVAPSAIPRTRVFLGEVAVMRVLRSGAWCGGGLLLLSLCLELLPQHFAVSVLISHLRVAGASVLLVTPIARLVVGGVTLAMNGEHRYLVYAIGVLALLAIAVSAGFTA